MKLTRGLAVLARLVIALIACAPPADAVTSDWRWQSRRVVVVDQTRWDQPTEVRAAVRQLQREQPYLSWRYTRGECPTGAHCINVAVRDDDPRPTWTAKALTAEGDSCRVFLNGYWDAVVPAHIKPELMRCVGLRTAPEGVRSLMSATDPAPRLTWYDLRDLRTLYRER